MVYMKSKKRIKNYKKEWLHLDLSNPKPLHLVSVALLLPGL